MQHPVELVGRLGKFVDELIRQHGDYLFLGWTLLSLAVLVWIFSRRNNRNPIGPIRVVPPREFPQAGKPPKMQTNRSVPPEPQRPEGGEYTPSQPDVREMGTAFRLAMGSHAPPEWDWPEGG